MVCLVSDQVLPNYIPVNEPATRPAVLHGIFTPGEARMKQNWENLKKVIAQHLPEVKTEDVPIKDAYDAQEIQRVCERLLIDDFPEAEWKLNATGGTKLMSASASEVFNRNGCAVYYVESWRNRTLQVAPDWATVKIAFTETLAVETYFQLYGKQVEHGTPRTGKRRTWSGN